MSSAVPAKLSDLLQRAGLGAVSKQTMLLLALAIGVALALAGWRLIGARGEVVYETSADEPAASGEASSEAQMSAEETPAQVWVHVVGAVREPGVYAVAADARVGDVVGLAGGLLGNAAPEGVNLARAVGDGEQIRVPTLDEWVAGAAANPSSHDPGGGADSQGSDGVVDLNSADATLLETLPGVGPSTAAKIVDDREANGSFASVDDLMRVSGIGEKKLETIRELVVVR